MTCDSPEMRSSRATADACNFIQVVRTTTKCHEYLAIADVRNRIIAKLRLKDRPSSQREPQQAIRRDDSRKYKHQGVALPFCMVDEPGSTSPWVCLGRAATPAFELRRYSTYSIPRTPDLQDADRIAQPQVSAPEGTSVTAAGIQVAGRVSLRHVANIRGHDRRVSRWHKSPLSFLVCYYY
ncbi:hypothetical protein ACQKWADRAFT_6650 [Trichoderma austrokoningii]